MFVSFANFRPPDRGRHRRAAATRDRTRQPHSSRGSISLGATHYLTDAAGRDLITGEDRSALLRVRRPWFGPPQIDDRLVVVDPRRTAAIG